MGGLLHGRPGSSFRRGREVQERQTVPMSPSEPGPSRQRQGHPGRGAESADVPGGPAAVSLIGPARTADDGRYRAGWIAGLPALARILQAA